MKTKTLVLGASLNEERYSNFVIKRLVAKEIEVLALGLKKGVVSGISIDTKPVLYKNIDTVTLYLNSNRQKEYYGYIISLNPRRVIFNPGTENSDFRALLEKNNIATENSCTLVLLSTNQY